MLQINNTRNLDEFERKYLDRLMDLFVIYSTEGGDDSWMFTAEDFVMSTAEIALGCLNTLEGSRYNSNTDLWYEIFSPDTPEECRI